MTYTGILVIDSLIGLWAALIYFVLYVRVDSLAFLVSLLVVCSVSFVLLWFMRGRW